MTLLKDTIAQAEEFWPVELAEEWDSIGLVCGNPQAEITSIVFCVDPTHEVIDEAIEHGAQLIIAHHPLYLKGTTSVAANSYKGSLIHRMIQNEIALYTAHTNADSATDGVSDQLIQACGVETSQPLVPHAHDASCGLGRVGKLAQPVALKDFAHALADELPATVGGIRVAGNPEQLIECVAVCGGSGDSLFDAVRASGADVYVTSDLRHHPALEAVQTSGIALIDTAHFASEGLWLAAAAEQFEAAGYETFVSETISDPWDSLILQSGE